MHQTLIKRRMDSRPSPEDMVIKSCIMHVRHNDARNERRAMLLCRGQIMMGMRAEFSRWGHHGDNNVAAAARTAERLRLAQPSGRLTGH